MSIGRRVVLAVVLTSVCVAERGVAQTVTSVVPQQIAASGTVSASGAVGAMDVTGMQSVGVQLSGSWSGSVYYEISQDNTAYTLTRCVPQAGGPPVNGAGTNGAWQCDVNGFAWFRLNVTAIAGTASWAMRKSASPAVPVPATGPQFCLAALCPPPIGGMVP